MSVLVLILYMLLLEPMGADGIAQDVTEGKI